MAQTLNELIAEARSFDAHLVDRLAALPRSYTTRELRLALTDGIRTVRQLRTVLEETANADPREASRS